MESLLRIKALERSDISTIIDWARNEGFGPGRGDFEIYRNTDKQGMWMGWLGNTPVGCISAIRYNEEYGFIGLYLCLLYTSPSPRDVEESRMPSSA